MGVPETEKDSPFTNPEYAAVPEIVAVVFPSYVLLEIEIPVIVNPFTETVLPEEEVATFVLDAPVLVNTTDVALLYEPAASVAEKRTYTVVPLDTETEELKIELSLDTS